MKELLKVTVKDDQQLVSARDLHKGLKPTTRFSKWVNQNFKDFEENTDFCPVTTVTQQNQYGGTKEIQDYALTLDMAKQLCLMSHTDKGKQYRKYLIQVEKNWNDPKEIVKRGYTILQDENTRLKLENSQMKPKALFADAVSTSKKTVLVGELAKILKGNGIDIGQNRLFSWLREHGYLIRRNGSDRNMPTQKAMDLGLFKIKETSISHADGHLSVQKTPKVTGKGQQYFINLFLKNKNLQRV